MEENLFGFNHLRDSVTRFSTSGVFHESVSPQPLGVPKGPFRIFSCTLTSEYLRKFSKKFETVLMGYSGAGEKLIHEKNQKQKISWHCPFKRKYQQTMSGLSSLI